MKSSGLAAFREAVAPEPPPVLPNPSLFKRGLKNGNLRPMFFTRLFCVSGPKYFPTAPNPAAAIIGAPPRKVLKPGLGKFID